MVCLPPLRGVGNYSPSLVPDSQASHFDYCVLVAPEMLSRVHHRTALQAVLCSRAPLILDRPDSTAPRHFGTQRPTDDFVHLSPAVSPRSSACLSIRLQKLIGATRRTHALSIAIG